MYHDRHARDSMRASDIMLASALLVFAFCAYLQFGFRGALIRDDSVVVYTAQMMQAGIPPYESIFQPKTPLAGIVAGVGLSIARAIGVRADDLKVIRYLFLIISAIVPSLIYGLGRSIQLPRAAAFLAGSSFIHHMGFGRHAASGPRAKSPMVLFEVAWLTLTARRQWFWAGVAAGTSFLVWQPMGITIVITASLAFAQSGRKSRFGNVIKSIIGFSIPLLLIASYFLHERALELMILDAFYFPLFLMEHGQNAPPIVAIRASIEEGYSSTIPIIASGALGLLMLMGIMLRKEGDLKRFICHNRTAALALLTWAALIWSLIDYQGYPDFYVFLPLVSVGFGWLSYGVCMVLAKRWHKAGAASILTSLLGLALIISASWEYRLSREEGLISQESKVNNIECELSGKDDSLLWTPGRPEALVLTGNRSPTRHIVLNSGEDKVIQATFKGGIRGWFESNLHSASKCVVLGAVEPPWFRALLAQWLEDNALSAVQKGPWTIYIRRPN